MIRKLWSAGVVVKLCHTTLAMLLVVAFIAISIPLTAGTAEAAYDNGFWYRKTLTYTGAAGAGTDYEVLVLVGETSGAVGEDFSLEGKAVDFPHDLLFVDNDDVTEIDHDVIAVSGTTPNRLAAVRVAVADSLEAGETYYCYFGQRYYTSTSSGTDTFHEYGTLGAMNEEWLEDTGEEFTEHSVIYGGEVYVTTPSLATLDGGFQIYSIDGELQGSYASSVYSIAAPVVWEYSGQTYVYLYDYMHGYIYMVRVSDDTIVHTAKLSASGGATTPDLEGMGWDWTNNRLITTSYENTAATEYLTAYDMTDLSVAWHYVTSWDNTGNQAVPLVLGSYVYHKPNDGNSFYKLNLGSGTLAGSLNLGAFTHASYASPMYDPNNQVIYLVYEDNMVACVDPTDMSSVWTHTFTAVGTGMTSPLIHNAMAYYNNLVFCPVRDNAAGGTQYHAKLYALDALDGSEEWVATTAWTLGYDYTTMLLTEEHIAIPCHDVLIARDVDYMGEIHVFEQDTGTLVAQMAQAWQPMCGGLTQVINGNIISNMAGGYVGGYKLGWGSTEDSVHYHKNSYHNGYAGDLLEFDPDLPFLLRNAVVPDGWVEDTANGTITSEGLGMRILQNANAYAHVEKAAPAIANFVAEGQVRAEDASCSWGWGPSVVAYWGVDDWVQVGTGYTSNPPAGYQIHGGYAAAGVYTDIQPGTMLSYGTYYWVRVRVDNTDVYFDYSTDYVSWTNIGSVARHANWAGAPALIIVGKGRSLTASGYVNPDFDNDSSGLAGAVAVTWYKNIQVRKYGNATEPAFSSAGALEGVGPTIPVITTVAASAILPTSAVLNSYLDDDGDDICSVRFQYYREGGAWTDSATPWVNGITTGASPSYPITGLVTDSTYYFRAQAKNLWGTVNGDPLSFTPTSDPLTPPTVTTIAAVDETTTEATLQGGIVGLGNYTTVYAFFEWGLTTTYDHSTTEQTKTAVGSFSHDLSGLLPNTTYHYRAVLRYSAVDYVYGADMSFLTGASSSVTTIASTANVFHNYIEEDDTLFVMEYTNTYSPYYDDYPVYRYFLIQLLDTDAVTVLFSTTCKQWGNRPASIYVSADQSAMLTDGDPYVMRLYGDFDPYPEDAYVLQPSDWKGDELFFLDEWVFLTARHIEDFDEEEYVVTAIDRDVLNNDGGALFLKGIPDLDKVRPNIFLTSFAKPALNPIDGADPWKDVDSSDMLGADITAATDAVAAEFGVTGEQVRTLLYWILLVGAVVLVFSVTKSFPASIGVCIPLLGLGVYMRTVDSVAGIGLIALLFGVWLVNVFWLKA